MTTLKKLALPYALIISLGLSSNARAEDEPKPIGKEGKIEIAEKLPETYHVTARVAEAMRNAATCLAWILKSPAVTKQPPHCSHEGSASIPQAQPYLLLSANDLDSYAYYLSSQDDIKSLIEAANEFKGKLGSKIKSGGGKKQFYAASSQPLGLINFIEFTKLFRTDKRFSFGSTSLPASILTDALKTQLGPGTSYPQGAMIAAFAGLNKTCTGIRFKQLLELRAEIAELLGLIAKDPKSEEDKSLIAQTEALFKAIAEFRAGLFSVIDKQRVIGMQYAVQGELVARALSNPLPNASKPGEHSECAFETGSSTGIYALVVDVVQQGGTLMQQSSVFRSDRLYASGGLIVQWRILNLANGFDVKNSLVASGVLTQTKGFKQILEETE